MHKEQYYPEDILIEKLESGEYGWLDFVNHHSAEWQEEYLLYCKENDFLVGDPSAEEFVHFKDNGDTKEYQPTGDGSAAGDARHPDAQRYAGPYRA